MKKALIVDDNEQNRYLLQTMLKGQGYNVLTAADGVEALEQARSDSPDIVISDILMPVMDGFVFCREWQKDERLQKIPFVFYTATYTDPKDEDFALSLGAARFMVKPQDPEALVALLQQIINEYKSSPPVAPAQPAPEEKDYYRLYSEVLVRKLEDKMLALEEINRALGQEITMRKKAEEKLARLNKQHELILSSAAEGILGLDSQGNHTFVNPAAARELGCEAEELLGRPSHSTWHHTKPDGSPYPREECNIYAAYLDGAVHRTSAEVFWRKDGASFPVEYASTPIYEKGWPVGAVVTFANITERKQAEEQLKHTLDSLRNAVSATVQIVATTVEARDPYTAGHQTRSADLACAIATEMKLPQEKIDAIRMAGSIHDIGKISVPAEILSKPTKLSEIEFSLIKEHSRRGYEILKDVESPWSLAEIAYQHHERMDGSGYPRNLKGDEILIEARILAVADTVEAMASHRPYRPGLGIDAALEEIKKNKGIIYDADAVDACQRLFREKRYELPH